MTRALIVCDVQNEFSEGGSLAESGGADEPFRIGTLLRTCHEPDYRHSWPRHCVVGTDGEALHPNLDPQPFDAVFLKGEREAAYSGFEGVEPSSGTRMAAWLRQRDVDTVDICGLTTDYCVRTTALDARQEGFRTRLLLNYCAGVAPETTERAVRDMSSAGVAILELNSR